MRTDFSFISMRYSEVNNKYLTSYDPKKLTKYIKYLDKNNLCVNDFSKSLPKCRFKWLDPAKFRSDKYDDNTSRGCILEADLEYRKKIHKLHNNYPLAADTLKIKKQATLL